MFSKDFKKEGMPKTTFSQEIKTSETMTRWKQLTKKQ